MFPSLHLVSITIIVTLCSQVIRQKSSTVPGSGPWLAMYSRSYVYPYIQWMYLSTRKILYDVFNCLYYKVPINYTKNIWSICNYKILSVLITIFVLNRTNRKIELNPLSVREPLFCYLVENLNFVKILKQFV